MVSPGLHIPGTHCGGYALGGYSSLARYLASVHSVCRLCCNWCTVYARLEAMGDSFVKCQDEQAHGVYRMPCVILDFYDAMQQGMATGIASQKGSTVIVADPQ